MLGKSQERRTRRESTSLLSYLTCQSGKELSVELQRKEEAWRFPLFDSRNWKEKNKQKKKKKKDTPSVPFRGKWYRTDTWRRQQGRCSMLCCNTVSTVTQAVREAIASTPLQGVSWLRWLGSSGEVQSRFWGRPDKALCWGRCVSLPRL